MDRDEVREREKLSSTPGDWREWGWEWENNPLSSSASCIRERKKNVLQRSKCKGGQSPQTRSEASSNPKLPLSRRVPI